MACVPSHPFFGNRSWGNELAPLFRLMDEPSFPFGQFNARLQPNFSFTPRFDVREVGDKYELRGELPGVEAENLHVEFSDEKTLIIRGQVDKEQTSGTDKAVEAAPTDDKVADDNESTYSTGSYQKPSVEGEEDEVAATPAESTPETAEAPAEAQPETKEAEPAQEQARYWLHERSTGTFQRTFNFSSRIDQEAVTASLKNGILSVVVPKLAAPAAKRITVE